jgi:hypothetical protein
MAMYLPWARKVSAAGHVWARKGCATGLVWGRKGNDPQKNGRGCEDQRL